MSGVRAAAFLIGAGLMAGFFLSSGTSRLLQHRTAAVGQAEGRGGGTPASAERGGGKHGKRGSIAQDGDGAEHGGGNGGGAGRTARATGAVTDGDDGAGGDEQSSSLAAPAGAPPAKVDSLADLVSGNTLTTSRSGGTMVRYLSSKGWQGEGDRSSFAVRRWTARDNRLCVVDATNAASCGTFAFLRAPKPPAGIGAVLGTLTAVEGTRWTVLRGNSVGFPETIPLILGVQWPPQVAAPAAPSATGQKAFDAMVGRTLLKVDPSGEPVGERYENDGRWVNVQPLQPGAKTGLGGVQVRVGHWEFKAGLLCLDQPGLDLKRECFAPEQWGKNAFQLHSNRNRPAATTYEGDDL